RSGHQKRHEQTDTQRRQGVAQITGQGSGLEDGTEGATGTGDQQDRRRLLQAMSDMIMELLTLAYALEQQAGQHKTDQQRSDRLTEETQHFEEGTSAEGLARKGRERTQAEQHDMQEDRRKGLPGARQFAVAGTQRIKVDVIGQQLARCLFQQLVVVLL